MTNVSAADIIYITVADITSKDITSAVISAKDRIIRKGENLMKCPVCGKEMETGCAGYTFGTKSTGGFFWAPEKFRKKSIIATKGAVKRAGGNVFSLGWSVFDTETRDAWRCKECEIVVVDAKK